MTTPTDFRRCIAPSAADFEAIANEVLEELRATPFGEAIKDLLVRVDEFCDEEIEREMGLESPYDLLGLYSGVSIDRQSVHDVRTQPDFVFLYRRPILDYWCENDEDLHHVVRHVLIHEIGHHLGFSDDDMHAIEESGD